MRVPFWFPVMLLGVSLCSLSLSGGENLATTTLVYPCLPAAVPILVDGRLTAAEWDGTVPAAGFTVSGSNTLAPEPVLMRLAWDRKNLYLGITCLEANMKGLHTSGAGQHDGAFWLDDAVEFFLDLDHDHETYLQFAVTAKGIRYENNQGDSTWNTEWQAAVVRGADRWTVEIALPFAGLVQKPPQAGDFWGFNLCRERRAGGHLELYNWANVERVFKNVQRFGHLAFLPANWQASADTARPLLRRAAGEEARLVVAHGIWSMRRGEVPIYTAFLEQLRARSRRQSPFFAKIESLYAATSDLPYAGEYRRLADEYAGIHKLIAAGKPLKAAAFDRAAGRLERLEPAAEALYWRGKLAALNRAMK